MTTKCKDCDELQSQVLRVLGDAGAFSADILKNEEELEYDPDDVLGKVEFGLEWAKQELEERREFAAFQAKRANEAEARAIRAETERDFLARKLGLP